jgi:thioredoxin 1
MSQIPPSSESADKPRKSTFLRNVVMLAFAVLAMAVVSAFSRQKQCGCIPPRVSAPLPKLLDLGADKCIPCKKMAPILEELKAEYAGLLEVEFIDVWKDSGAGRKYGIQTIPTQIFYDASGNELFRHEGLFEKDEILTKWKELGLDLQTKKNAGSGNT